tara:strand:- start:3117 stop:3914 length:798 start_codon:yes stop_codon:yes gene_type:complete
MATIVDTNDGRHNEEEVKEQPQQSLDSMAVSEEEEAAVVSEPVVPDKYQGKSVTEIVKMHQEAEQLLGRQSSEVGELRKVVDEFVMSQSTKEKDVAVEEEYDYFTDPEKAIQAAISKHPAVREAQEVSGKMRQTTAQAHLKEKHPDMKEILTDSNFIGWVKDSSFRTKLLQNADRNYDLEAADEIFSQWKERKALVGQTATAEKNSRSSTIKAANTGNTFGSADSGSSKKVFRRADIIKLMRNDPRRYESLSGEIMAAYAEGRVK